jgi:5-hydroxyisourate hydrolase / 2-oxo-4-hydroxy-4-carboxy-5-ureidoimidazoline decarboxylase
MTFDDFNKLKPREAKVELLKCCGSEKWVDKMIEHFPFQGSNTIFQKANHIWYDECSEKDWLEAFKYHPKIGDISSLKKKYANSKDWASGEQSEVDAATEETIENLAKINQAYEEKFGYIFIVCATGKTADEMLQLAEARLENGPKIEIHLAMGEQQKITLIRLQKLLEDISSDKKSQITTHVLDTSIGSPGKGILVRLQSFKDEKWQNIAIGLTDKDGRVGDLLPAWKILPPANYQIVFETGGYFKKSNTEGFYPEVSICFTVFDESHYHVPLLLNPYGYSTYRGS